MSGATRVAIDILPTAEQLFIEAGAKKVKKPKGKGIKDASIIRLMVTMRHGAWTAMIDIHKCIQAEDPKAYLQQEVREFIRLHA